MMQGKHFLSLENFKKNELEQILKLAEKLKSERKAGKDHTVLAGKTLAMLFLQPSNRTRLSFEVGMYQLGGRTVNIRPNEIRLGEREPIADVARVMARYVDGIMMRVMKHDVIVEFAKYSDVPVINGLSDHDHPCQAVSDMLTIQEKKGKLAGLKLAYVGDGNNVANSLIHACHLLGMQMIVACPKGFEPTVPAADFKYEVTHSPEEAVSGVDVIYTDVWTSMGQEDDRARRLKKFRNFCVTEALFAKAASDAIFMHCLPAHRGEEVVDEIVEHPRSVVFDQAENRLHAQKAILALLMSAKQ